MVTLLICLACTVAGFLFGKIHERAAWSDLIHKGVLPKPLSGE